MIVSIYCAIMGYIFGIINPSFLLGKLKGGDLRKTGLKNASALNAFYVFGKPYGVFCALFDVAKAYLSLFIAASVFPEAQYVVPITAVFCIIGHIYPFPTDFIGGKGLSCLYGVILYIDWRIFIAAAAVGLAIVILTDYIAFAPLSLSLLFPIAYGFIHSDLIGALILFAAAPIILIEHIKNLRAIREGSEMGFRAFLTSKPLSKTDAPIEENTPADVEDD